MNDQICICGDPNCTIPYGTCHCGCGNITTVSSHSDRRCGAVKDKPRSYLRGHVVAQGRPNIEQPTDTSIRLIPLTNGHATIIDASDYEWLSRWRWMAQVSVQKGKKVYYACRDVRKGGKVTKYSIHGLIIQPREGFVADHIDGDTLNNRRSNLREASPEENAQNRGMLANNKTGVHGVSWNVAHRKYAVYLGYKGKNMYLGEYVCLEEATRVRAEAEEKYYGKFRRR